MAQQHSRGGSGRRDKSSAMSAFWSVAERWRIKGSGRDVPTRDVRRTSSEAPQSTRLGCCSDLFTELATAAKVPFESGRTANGRNRRFWDDPARHSCVGVAATGSHLVWSAERLKPVRDGALKGV
jgi:hypothetical protein